MRVRVLLSATGAVAAVARGLRATASLLDGSVHEDRMRPVTATDAARSCAEDLACDGNLRLDADQDDGCPDTVRACEPPTFEPNAAPETARSSGIQRADHCTCWLASSGLPAALEADDANEQHDLAREVVLQLGRGRSVIAARTHPARACGSPELHQRRGRQPRGDA